MKKYPVHIIFIVMLLIVSMTGCTNKGDEQLNSLLELSTESIDITDSQIQVLKDNHVTFNNMGVSFKTANIELQDMGDYLISDYKNKSVLSVVFSDQNKFDANDCKVARGYLERSLLWLATKNDISFQVDKTEEILHNGNTFTKYSGTVKCVYKDAEYKQQTAEMGYTAYSLKNEEPYKYINLVTIDNIIDKNYNSSKDLYKPYAEVIAKTI